MNRRDHGVLIMAGGTGGHIFPGLAVANALRGQGIAVRWLGANGGMECRHVPPEQIPMDTVDIVGVRGKGPGRWLVMPWRLLKAVHQAFRLLGAHRPACAVSFGGYAAGPGGIAVRLRRVPLIVHEQNRVPGMTNRVLARLAEHVLQAFPSTFSEKLNPRTCGNPVRAGVAAVDHPTRRFAGRTGPIRLLVTGGSQGAQALNRVLPRALALVPLYLRPEVLHQAGAGWLDRTARAYDEAGIQAQLTEFIEDMPAAYAWADLVICRAGALTISELAAVGMASVLVPYPHAVDDHQTKNAQFLVDAGAAILLPESECKPAILASHLQQLLGDRRGLLKMAEAARAVAIPDAADRVASYCLEFNPA